MTTAELNVSTSLPSSLSPSSSASTYHNDFVSSPPSPLPLSSAEAPIRRGGEDAAPQNTDPLAGLPWSSALQSGRESSSSSEDRSTTLASSWAELWELESVEHVLTPLMVTLIVVSNMVLLLHETRVVWRTKKLIQPKLLVLALSAADLLATLVGFLPLWLIFVFPEGREVETGGGKHVSSSALGAAGSGLINENSASNSSVSEELSSSYPSSSTTTTTRLTTSPPQLQPTPPFSSPGHRYPMVHTSTYAALLFILSSFWTLAQCIVVVMGVERFLALRAPFFYTARCTCGAFLAVLGLLALTSCGIGGFHLFTQLNELQQRSSNDENGNANSKDVTELMVFAGFMDTRSLAHDVYTLVQGVVWSLVLLTCNWAVRRELRRMEQRVTVVRVKDQSEYLKQLSLVHGAGREFARFVMAVNVIFLLSSSPTLVCVLLRTCRRAPRFSIQYFCWRVSHISALLNPFLYGFLRKSLRSRTRRFLNRHLPCLRAQRVGEADAGPSSGRTEHGVERDLQHAKTSGCVPKSPNSAIIPQDPEASTLDLSD